MLNKTPRNHHYRLDRRWKLLLKHAEEYKQEISILKCKACNKCPIKEVICNNNHNSCHKCKWDLQPLLKCKWNLQPLLEWWKWLPHLRKRRKVPELEIFSVVLQMLSLKVKIKKKQHLKVRCLRNLQWWKDQRLLERWFKSKCKWIWQVLTHLMMKEWMVWWCNKTQWQCHKWTWCKHRQCHKWTWCNNKQCLKWMSNFSNCRS